MSNEQEVESIETGKQKEDKMNMMEERFNAIQPWMLSLITHCETRTKQVNTHLQNICLIVQLKTEEYPQRSKHFL